MFYPINILLISNFKNHLTITIQMCIIKIGNGETTNVVCPVNMKNTLNREVTDVFFIGYFCLLITITNAIIKANVMIVIPIIE